MITPEFKGFLHSIVETRDIGAILAVQGDTLDYSYIASWAAQIGAGEVWDALVAAYRSAQP